MTELSAHHGDAWTRRRLYMDETSEDADLEAYVNILLARARGVPVLQFNRVDFRLPWLRATYPRARLIHLYRNPRDQWCSGLRSGAMPRDVTIDRFAPYDHFFLRAWAEDLAPQFPFLDPARGEVAYRIFYYLWRLSYWFGVAYAHHSLSFESLVEHPSPELARLMAVAGLRLRGNPGRLLDPPGGPPCPGRPAAGLYGLKLDWCILIAVCGPEGQSRRMGSRWNSGSDRRQRTASTSLRGSSRPSGPRISSARFSTPVHRLVLRASRRSTP